MASPPPTTTPTTTRSSTRRCPALVVALVALAAAVPATAQQPTPELTVAVACDTPAGAFPHLWRSCGYSPAEMALRLDGVENTARIGAVPGQGVRQVRIHFILDLLTVTGFVPNASAPSGFNLLYDWSNLDFLVDTLVANNLSPGFELMGSPAGFPTLPTSFFTPWNNNFVVYPNQTLAMFRTLTRDIILRYAGRHGVDEVAGINWETWNEPECGWGWPALTNVSSPAFVAYTLMWDAAAAGVEDAEALLGTPLVFGGPGSCRDPGSTVVQWLMRHAETGVNNFTGKPARLDFLSLHYKGRSTSYLVAEQALSGFTLMREPGPNQAGPKVQATPFYNDEADPMVGWLDPTPWRADGRYGAIIPKVINQHFLQIVDNRTATSPDALNNPLGLISNDNGFLNLDGYNGFEMRTLVARFTDNATGRYALIRKQGLHAMALLSKLGNARVAYSGPGAAGPDEVASSFTGVLATVLPPAPGVAGPQVAVLVYNSNDTMADNTTAPTPTQITLNAHPFTASTPTVVLVVYALDNTHANPYAVWTAAGSPPLPSTPQLLAMWAADGLKPSLGPLPLAVTPGQPLVLPAISLPLPGVAVFHVVAQAQGAPAPASPVGVRAFAKDPSSSLLDPTQFGEVLVRWNCEGVAQTTLGFTVQLSSSGAAGPWTTVQDAAQAGDFTCTFLHALPASAGPGTSAWYRVSTLDYFGVASGWSEAVQAAPWPAAP
jgi:L-iduronidase